MQTNTLPIQISSAGPGSSPLAAPARANSTANANGFSQALNQTMSQNAQRQATPAPAAQPAKAAAQSSTKPNSAPADKAPANRPSSDSAKPAQAAATTRTDKPASAAAVADDAARDAAAAAEAAANAPVVDMLALVASFNQPLTPKAVAASASVADDSTPAQAPIAAATGSLTDPAALQASAALNLPNVPAAPLAAQPAAPLAGAGMLAQLPQAHAEAAPQLAIDPAAERAVPMQSSELAAAVPADDAPAQSGATFTAAMSAATDKPGVRAGAQEQFTVKDIGPLQDTQPTAPAAAPLQQSAMAQAVANAAGDKIAARVGTTAWDNQVSQKIVWMVAGGEQSASLTLNPPDLGPMQVVLSVTNDHADVTFSAAQPEVRQALEDAMPRLREMLSESGLSLGNANVNADLPQQRQAQADMNASGGAGRHAQGDAGADDAPADNGSAADLENRAAARAERTGTVRSMVDTFV